MSGSLEMARSVVETYRAETATAAHTVNTLAQRIEEILGQISDRGPLGTSREAHVAATRSHLARARQLLIEAADHIRASREPMARYVQRAFPG